MGAFEKSGKSICLCDGLVEDFGKNSNLYIFIILCTILTNVICILILQLFENKRLIDLLLFIGATSLQVENIFIFRNMKLILRSMVIGAVFAFVLGFLQMKYRFVGLDSSDYYVSFVPIYFDLEMFLLCFFVMLLALLMGLKMTFRFMKKSDQFSCTRNFRFVYNVYARI